MKLDQQLKYIYILISVALTIMLFFQGYLLIRQYQLLKAKVYEVVLNNYNELNNEYNNISKFDTNGRYKAFDITDSLQFNKPSVIADIIIQKNGAANATTQVEKLKPTLSPSGTITIKANPQSSRSTILPTIESTQVKNLIINKNSVGDCDTCLTELEKSGVVITILMDSEEYDVKMRRLYTRIDTLLPSLYKQHEDVFSYSFGIGHVSEDSLKFYNKSFVDDVEEPFFKKELGSDEPIMFYLNAQMKTGYWLKHILIGVLLSILLVVTLFYLFYKLYGIITSQKRLDMMKTDFINNMTHEFKTPIATVSLALESIQNFGVRNQPEKMDEYLDIAQGELKKVNSMIEMVLNISKDSSFALKKTATNIPSLIEQSIEHMKTIAETHQAQFDVNVENEIPTILIDSFHMNNVFVNLIDNSFKYKREEPVITIKISSNENFVNVHYRDNGKGINEQYLPFIFDNFFRVPSGNIHNVKGFGVGLSYVSKIIREHHGTITVNSEVDQFTEFFISLPIQQS